MTRRSSPHDPTALAERTDGLRSLSSVDRVAATTADHGVPRMAVADRGDEGDEGDVFDRLAIWLAEVSAEAALQGNGSR